jgi:AraC-like DNA-binding protein
MVKLGRRVRQYTVRKGVIAVKTGQVSGIRPVRFTPPTSETGDIEVLSLERMRMRAGLEEFLDTQRLDFDMLLRVDRGEAVHTVDFTRHPLVPGDVLWVRAGQVQQWGRIEDVDGPVVLFNPHVVDDRTQRLVRSAGARTPNHWPAAGVDGSPVDSAWSLLLACGQEPLAGGRAELNAAVLAHAVCALLSLLAAAQPGNETTAATPTHEAYVWFRDEIDRRFAAWHKVTQYADRLGYSTRTLNRVARANTGQSAKQLVDERIVLEAKRLLSHADAPVAEIAGQLGFDDASNFSSYFLRRVGQTPGSFRAGTSA